jgi:hypothetical protein
MQCHSQTPEEPNGYYSPSAPLDICLATQYSSLLWQAAIIATCVHADHLGLVTVIKLTKKQTNKLRVYMHCCRLGFVRSKRSPEVRPAGQTSFGIREDLPSA